MNPLQYTPSNKIGEASSETSRWDHSGFEEIYRAKQLEKIQNQEKS